MEIIMHFVCIILSSLSPYLIAKYLLKKESIVKFIKNHCKTHSISIFHPNIISLLRTILAITAIILFHYFGSPVFIYTLLFAFGNDAVDGEVARKCDLGTEFGEKFDPLCDKISYIIPIIYFCAKGYIPLDYGYYLILAEIFGQTVVRWIVKLLVYLSKKIKLLKRWNELSVAANNIGKVKGQFLN